MQRKSNGLPCRRLLAKTCLQMHVLHLCATGCKALVSKTNVNIPLSNPKERSSSHAMDVAQV
jgi:hypothetical protein